MTLLIRRKLLEKAVLVGILCCLPFAASAATPSKVTEEEKMAAQKMFEAGDGLYESGRYADAITAFKNSHNLVASPNSRLMLARSLREAGRNQEACEEFRGTIRDAEASGGRYPEALQAAHSELKALENQLAEAQDTARTSPLPAPAAVVIPAPAAPPGATQPASPRSDPPTRSNAMSTAAWVSAGVGFVGLSTFGLFAYLDRKTYRALESECQHAQCAPASMSDIDTGRRYQLVANVGLGVAIVGAAAATTLFVLSPRREPASPQVALRATLEGLRVDGQF